MFFELRQYTATPGSRDALVKIMEDDVIPFQTKCGMVILGSFVGEERRCCEATKACCGGGENFSSCHFSSSSCSVQRAKSQSSMPKSCVVLVLEKSPVSKTSLLVSRL